MDRDRRRRRGTFKLADRIAAKVKAGEEINYIFSYQASGIPLFSPLRGRFRHRCKAGWAIYPMDCAIGSLNKVGQVHTIGWNVSKGQ